MAADKAAWKQRTIYQIIVDRFAVGGGATPNCPDLHQYCGGNWQGVIDKLPYIQELGFDAIWISPVVDNIPGGYHGYWARDWEKLNSEFGDEDTLHRLIDTAHNMDMWVMVDVVANHVAPTGHDFSMMNPFNKEEMYHEECDITDWNNKWQREHCRLQGLPDLD